jgi:hypothetical protein
MKYEQKSFSIGGPLNVSDEEWRRIFRGDASTRQEGDGRGHAPADREASSPPSHSPSKPCECEHLCESLCDCAAALADAERRIAEAVAWAAQHLFRADFAALERILTGATE